MFTACLVRVTSLQWIVNGPNCRITLMLYHVGNEVR